MIDVYAVSNNLEPAPAWLGWSALCVLPVLFMIYYLFFKLRIQDKEFIKYGFIKNSGLSTHILSGFLGTMIINNFASPIVTFWIVFIITIVYEVYQWFTEGWKLYGSKFRWFSDSFFDCSIVWIVSGLMLYWR